MINEATSALAAELFLVQHGEAVPEKEDPTRPLSAAGRQAVQKMAAWAQAAGIRPAQIRHSGKLRAQQTAELFAAKLQPPLGVLATEGLAPKDDPAPIAQALLQWQKPVMIVGHLPFLARLVGLLVSGSADCQPVAFQYGAIVALKHAGQGWQIECVIPPTVIPEQ